MTEHIKKVIDRYREKTGKSIKSEMMVFRVTPEEADLLTKVYGGPTGVRDYALASTDLDAEDLEYIDKKYPGDTDDDKR